MKYSIGIAMLLLLCMSAQAQHGFRISVRNKEGGTPLHAASAVLLPLNKTVLTDSLGSASFTGVAPGKYLLRVGFVGMEEWETEITIPLLNDTPIDVALSPAEPEEEEVIVTATRASRSINDIPTRVETISGEELGEKANMKPGDIRMLLSESTGIQTQQTSATSYNSSIRIQGLDGRYTQVLRDGFPLYAGFSGGLSLMQVAPLDLKQIEVIKGSTSTLYGGGAIAGLVNLVSKTPGTEKELLFMSNLTSAGGLDLSGFYSQRFKTIGVTVYGSSNTGKAYDPAGIGLTAIPSFERYTINPKLFWYSPETNASMGFSYVTEQRIGGSMAFIRNEGTGYFERNHTDRFSSQFLLTHQTGAHAQLSIRNSISRFKRLIETPSYVFNGLQHSSFSEVAFSVQHPNMQWVTGLNLLTDQFREASPGVTLLRDYAYQTLGGFVQNTWSPVEKLTVETGLRIDHTKRYGFEWLPRFSVLYKPTQKIALRMGGGLGYKIPTVFTEESERIQFQQIQPIDAAQARDERSAGVNADVNYRTRLGELGFTFNQLFFYTRLNSPLVLVNSGTGYAFVNASGHIDTKGMETNLRLVYHDLKLFIGYTYADVNTHFNNKLAWLPLTARHRLNNVLIYEREGNVKIGLEAYFFSPQLLSDGTQSPSYWTFGVMGEKTWKQVTLFINFENLTDTRQTRFGSIYTGSLSNPTFKDIYAPLDGFVVNGGLKIRL